MTRVHADVTHRHSDVTHRHSERSEESRRVTGKLDGAGRPAGDPSGFDVISRLLAEFDRTRRFGTLDRWRTQIAERLASLTASASADPRARREADAILAAFEAAGRLLNDARRLTPGKAGRAIVA